MKWETEHLFDVPDVAPAKKAKRKELPAEHLWTGNKAHLIAEYLFRFVLVTKSGTYIDGFAGPQNVNQLDAWAAKRVLESKNHPPWLRHHHLFEKNARSVDLLQRLRAEKAHPDRDIQVYQGDFNRRVSEILAPDFIDEREPTFALLDQRTFECHWATVEQLASYLRDRRDYKIEVFYFLADKWLGRAAGGAQPPRLEAWWGGPGYEPFLRMRSSLRAHTMTRRFVDELGYSFASQYPIYEQAEGGRIAYYMIHASDHPDALRLMDEAYGDAVLPADAPEKLSLF